jgi:hypothetical protein
MVIKWIKQKIIQLNVSEPIVTISQHGTEDIKHK